MKTNNKFYYLLIVLAIGLVPLVAVAQTLTGSTYQVEDSTFDGGGESSSSTNYRSRDSIGDVETGESSSTDYKSIPGFQPGAYPGIPAQPTLTNTGGTLYNSLDFVMATGDGQQSDTTYAIAISPDDFVTTFFIQTDDTIGATPAWQTYIGWNSGTGERVTGLSPSTTYKIKVKARYGPDSESGYSLTASATTAAPSITVSITGISSGTCIENAGGSCPPGYNTTATSTSSTMGFNTLLTGDGDYNISGQRITVTTNATGGYSATVQQNNDLTSSNADTIAPVSGSNAVPAAFDTGVTNGRFGYHTTDPTLCTGTSGRFSASNDLFAALTGTPSEVACSNSEVTSEVTDIVFKIVVGNLQEAGNYENTLTYIATATY